MTVEQQLEDIQARYNPLVRARNEFFSVLRKKELNKEQLVSEFEKIFNVSAEKFDAATVQRWDEMPEYLKNKSMQDEYGQSGKMYFKAPNEKLEFSRYKQDCRKRALEMAHSQYAQKGACGKDEADQPVEYITTCAEQYYQWLINLPQ